MKLIVVRHGETDGNVNEIVQGHAEGQLTEKGILQAKALAERFKNTKIDVIFSSDLQRAINTAKEIAKYHPNTEFKSTSLIKERGYGDFEGKHIGIYRKAKGEKSKYDFNHSSCEHCGAVEKRAEEFLKIIKDNYQNKTVLAVAHGGFNRYIIGSAIGLPQEKRHHLLQSNTCVNVFDYTDGCFVLNLFNCTKHLA